MSGIIFFIFASCEPLMLLSECFILVGSAMFGTTFDLITRQSLVKNGSKTRFLFVKKLIRVGLNFANMRAKYDTQAYQIIYGETLDLQCAAFSTVAPESFNGKFAAKIDFPIGHFYITITDTGIGSLKYLHTLFDKYFHHKLVKFEQNRMVRNNLFKIFSFLAKKW